MVARLGTDGLGELLERAERHCRATHGIHRPKVSVCINTHNEGGRVRATVESFRQHLGDWPHEFVVVSDGVTDGCCDGLGPGVTVIVNAQRRGCGRAKGQAIAKATGDVLCFIDAHQNVVQGRLSDMVMAAYQAEAIYTPVIRMTEYDPKEADGWRVLNRWYQLPCAEGLRWDTTKQYMVRDDAWVMENHLKDIRMVGVGFCVSRRTLVERMGGVNGYLGLHGSQERGFSLRAYMAGVPVRLFGTVHIGHEFRAGKPKPEGFRGIPIGDAARNLWHCFYVISGNEAWRALRPAMEKQDGRGVPVLADSGVMAERARFLAVRRRSDADLLRLLGVGVEGEKRPDAVQTVSTTVTDSPKAAAGGNNKGGPVAQSGAAPVAQGQGAAARAAAGAETRRGVNVADVASMGARGYVEPKIDVRIPFEPGARLGAEYNRIMQDSPCDWVLFLDHDVLILHPSWYLVCQEVIRKTPNAGLFTCFTSVCGNVYQACPGAPTGHDIKRHRVKAREVWDKGQYNVTPITKQLIAGHFMLTSRAAWKKAGGFMDGFLGVDNDYHRRVMKAGMGVYRMDGVYAYHLRERVDGDWIKGVPVSSSIVKAWQATRPAKG